MYPTRDDTHKRGEQGPHSGHTRGQFLEGIKPECISQRRPRNHIVDKGADEIRSPVDLPLFLPACHNQKRDASQDQLPCGQGEEIGPDTGPQAFHPYPRDGPKQACHNSQKEAEYPGMETPWLNNQKQARKGKGHRRPLSALEASISSQKGMVYTRMATLPAPPLTKAQVERPRKQAV